MAYTLKLERNSLRRTNTATLRRQLQDIVDRGLGGNRGRKGWRLASALPTNIEPTQQGDGSWQYAVSLEFLREGKPVDDAAKNHEFSQITDYAAKATRSNGDWVIPGHVASPDIQNVITTDGVNAVMEIKIERATHFDELYGLDSQIEIVLASLRIAKDTRFEKRYHTVLHGKPGCGKSEMLRCIKNMTGEEGVLEFDGTQTTAAGAINTLIDAEVLPAVIIIEEIEKVPDVPFLWLLGVLDSRAEIKKTNNNGTRQRKIPSICLATVNDLELFESRHEGAMASRFAHQLYCPRPTDDVLRRILEREVASIQGNPAWIEPALRYCIDEEKEHDPRRVIAVCLTGRDALIDGSFQDNLRACAGPQKEVS